MMIVLGQRKMEEEDGETPVEEDQVCQDKGRDKTIPVTRAGTSNSQGEEVEEEGIGGVAEGRNPMGSEKYPLFHAGENPNHVIITCREAIVDRIRKGYAKHSTSVFIVANKAIYPHLRQMGNGRTWGASLAQWPSHCDPSSILAVELCVG